MMGAFEQQIGVLLIVGVASAYSIAALVPGSVRRRWTGRLLGRPVQPQAKVAAGESPACHGCPAGADCGKRRV
jgi:hypothetical protein